MRELRHSRQRDAIIEYLRSTKSHPTADMVYKNLKPAFPNISLGTVYRNLALLEELGEVRKISRPGLPDRFDGDISSHQHLICTGCGAVSDISIDDSNLDAYASRTSGCKVLGHELIFYCTCNNCKKINS